MLLPLESLLILLSTIGATIAAATMISMLTPMVIFSRSEMELLTSEAFIVNLCIFAYVNLACLVVFEAIVDIAVGQELLVNYGHLVDGMESYEEK